MPLSRVRQGPGIRAASTPVRAPRRRSTTVTVLEAVAIAIALAGLAWILPVLVGGGTGRAQVAAAAILAILPFAAITVLVRWIDAWEPEPRGLLLVALAWGAGVATTVAALGNSLFQQVANQSVGSETASALTAIVSAPLTEETMKGLGLVVVILVGRGQFHGPVDGVVYSLVIGAGFAAVENVQYFLTYWDSLTAVFVQRGLMSPLVHPMFTICTGLALGVASQMDRRGRWLLVVPGWAAAVGLHALWNWTAVNGSFGQVYLSFQVPLFVALTVLVLWLRRREHVAIRDGLRDYARAGWFAPHELDMLMSTRARRDAVRWAADRGRAQRAAMIDLQQAAVELALARRRARAGRPRPNHVAHEDALLRRMVGDRAVLARA